LAQIQGQNNRHAGMLSTPKASDMKAGGHGDVGRMGSTRHQLQQAMLPTPTATQYGSQSYPADPSRKRPSLRTPLRQDMMPTPLKSDRKGSLGVHGANGKVKSPNVPTFLRDRKASYAQSVAKVLSDHGLIGPSQTLPVTYGWMMGYPPGWLTRALLSAVREGRLPLVSSSKPSATPSSRKSRKRSAEPS